MNENHETDKGKYSTIDQKKEIPPSELVPNTPTQPIENQNSTYYPDYKNKYHKNKISLTWRKIFYKKPIQTIAIILNLIALGAFVYFGNKQAGQTHYALYISEKTMENTWGISQTDLRPFLWYDDEVINGIPKVGFFNPIIKFKNFGKSPAFNEVSHIFWQTDTTFMTDNFITKKVPSQQGEYSGAISATYSGRMSASDSGAISATP